jgi:4-hydroxy-tetrahydrodipicolinate reductase
MTSAPPPRAVLVGLGPIGLDVGRALAARGVTLIGAADSADGLAGGDLGVLVPGAPASPVARDAASVYTRARAGDVAVLCTASRLPALAPQIEAAVDAGLHVVSTCEELAHPGLRHPELAAALHERARGRGVAILGAGVNPGLVMDRLPLTVAWGVVRVEHVLIERVVDAGRRRGPLRAKIGAGLSLDAFRAGVAERRLGHVGLAESAALVAEGLGIVIGAIEETIDAIADPVGGQVLGVHQIACVLAGGRERVRLDLKMALGLDKPHDRVVITGDPSLEMRVEGGVQGDRATVGATVNAVLQVGRLAPGLYRATGAPYR